MWFTRVVHQRIPFSMTNPASNPSQELHTRSSKRTPKQTADDEAKKICRRPAQTLCCCLLFVAHLGDRLEAVSKKTASWRSRLKESDRKLASIPTMFSSVATTHLFRLGRCQIFPWRLHPCLLWVAQSIIGGLLVWMKCFLVYHVNWLNNYWWLYRWRKARESPSVREWWK